MDPSSGKRHAATGKRGSESGNGASQLVPGENLKLLPPRKNGQPSSSEMESLSKKSGGSVAAQGGSEDFAQFVSKLARVWPLPDTVRSGIEAMLDALPAPEERR